MEIGFIYAICAAITWGLVYTIDQKILYHITPVALLFINSIITLLIMMPFIFFNVKPIKEIFISTNTNLYLIFSTVALTALANFLIFSSIKNLNASTASIIEIAYPFFVVLFSFILFRSTPNLYFFIGGILIFIGSIIIIRYS